MKTFVTILRVLPVLALVSLSATAWAANSVTVTPSATTYNATDEGTVTFTVTLTYTDALSGLGLDVTAPKGWKYVSTAGANPPSLVPDANDGGTFSFNYQIPPTSPASFTFTFTVSYPADKTGDQVFSAIAASFAPPTGNPASVTAPNITLTPIPVAPAITIQPSNANLSAGQTATFTVAASGNPAPSYQWRKGAGNLSNGGNVSGATSATLTLANVGAADHNTTYSCYVSNGVNPAATSNAATLTVNYAPVITTQPTSYTVNQGQSHTFSVVADGYPTAFTYQGKKDGTDINGATSSSITFGNATVAHAGSYTVTVSNGVNPPAVSNAAVLTVNYTPTITSADHTSFLVGQAGTFTVTATGLPAPTFSASGLPAWATLNPTTGVLSGTPTSSAGSPLTIALTATNGVSPNASQSFTLTVQDQPAAPTITTQPSNQTVIQGQTATFTVVAAGVPAPSYQWKKDGTDIGGATNATLQLGNAQPANVGSYTVVVSNGVNPAATSNAATLTVNVPPTITTPPAGQTVSAGANVTFSVVASGTASMTYQWKKDGTAMSGATGTSLSLNGVTTSDAGSYTVTVSYANGASVTSSAAVLIVQFAPTITTQPAGQTVNWGQTATFSVSATGNPTPTYQWRFNSANIAGATNATLTLTNVQAAAAGSYDVVVSNAVGSATSNAASLSGSTGSVPGISQHPNSVTVNLGQTATFTVVATGTPTPSYQWRLNGVNIAGATAATLTLNNVQSTAAGSYTVIVANTAGSVTSNAATLTVTSAPVAPTITTQPVSLTVNAGANATFSVTASGTDPLSYQWGKNGTAIGGATNATFTLNNVTTTEAGSYTVVVSNSTGSATSNAATLTVNAARNFAGTYFGTLGAGRGSWALYVRDNNTAVFIAYLTAEHNAFVLNLIVASDGTFSISGSSTFAQTGIESRALASSPAARAAGDERVAASSVITLSGQISGGLLAGQIEGMGIALSGSADTTSGSGQAYTGFYSASALGSATGNTYTVVGPSGQALVVMTSSTSADGTMGTVTSSGQLSATTANGGQLSLSVNQAAQSVTATLTPAGTSTPIGYAGLSDTTPSTGRLANLSVRAPAGTGDQTLILGFYVGGAESKHVLLRGIGPTLAQYGVPGVLADPQLKLFSAAGTLIDQNNDWGGSAALANAFAAVNDFALPANSKDAALLVTLPLDGFTAQVTGADTSTGVALIEAYETETGTPAAHFTALSARNQVGTGDNILIAGFVLTGNAPKTVLIRGIGPTLANYGVSGVLADPKLELYAGSAKIYENDNWSGVAALSDAFTATQAFPLPANSRDAALLVTLQPGLYSAQVSGVGGTTGVTLVEIYVMP